MCMEFGEEVHFMTSFESVKGKVAIVTGAADGLGKAIATVFGQNGVHVIVSDINEELGQQVVEDIKAQNGSAHFFKANVANEDDVKNLVAFAIEKFGKLDGIVNNAGISAPNKVLHELTIEDFDRVQSINFKGVFIGMKYGIEAILKSKAHAGFVINIASLAGIKANSGMSLYTASKHAVVGLTKNAALDYAAHNITINAICPGTFRTAIWNGAPEEVIQDLAKKLSPNGRLGDPTEIAHLALFLASDLARFTNGSIISMDAGASAGNAIPVEWDNPGILSE